MNQRLELAVEATLDNRTYRLMVPFDAPFGHIFQILDAFKVQVSTMQDVAQKQQDAQQQQQQQDAQATAL
jgi:hypothetical protein